MKIKKVTWEKDVVLKIKREGEKFLGGFEAVFVMISVVCIYLFVIVEFSQFWCCI